MPMWMLINVLMCLLVLMNLMITAFQPLGVGRLRKEKTMTYNTRTARKSE